MKTLLLLFFLAASAFAEPVLTGQNGYTKPGVAGVDYPSPIRGTFIITGNAIATSGSPADLQTLTLTLPTGYTRYAVLNAWAYSTAAAGSMALGTIDVRTAAAGGGSSLLNAASALTALTAVNLMQSLTPVTMGVTYTSTSLVVRQTVNSLNAGTISVLLDLVFLP